MDEPACLACLASIETFAIEPEALSCFVFNTKIIAGEPIRAASPPFIGDTFWLVRHGDGMSLATPAELPGRAIRHESDDICFFRLLEKQGRPQAVHIGFRPDWNHAFCPFRDFRALWNMAFDGIQLPYRISSETLLKRIDKTNLLLARCCSICR